MPPSFGLTPGTRLAGTGSSRAYAIVIFALDVQTCRKRPVKCAAFFEVIDEHIQNRHRSSQFQRNRRDRRSWVLPPWRRVAPPVERDAGGERLVDRVLRPHLRLALRSGKRRPDRPEGSRGCVEADGAG